MREALSLGFARITIWRQTSVPEPTTAACDAREGSACPAPARGASAKAAASRSNKAAR